MNVFYWNIFKNVIYSCDLFKAEFPASLLQSSVSVNLICWFAALETFLIIIHVENSCAASYHHFVQIVLLSFRIY